ncbi:MAG TPA: ABC transporter permease [Blastocatellia bacterium]|nr:ABC transporter permease [Blastocatellia bacterium]
MIAMPDRDPLEEASREEAAERALDSQPVVMERGPGEAIVEPAVPAAPGLSDAFNEATVIETTRGRSPSEIIWLKLRRNRTAMFGLYTLAALYLAAVLAGFIAPYKYDTADHDLPFHPPMLGRIHFFDEAGKLSRPFVYAVAPVAGQHAVYTEDRTKKYPLRLFVKGDRYHILWLLRSDVHLFGVDQPGRFFLFGSDLVGQDIFSRILYGAQVSLSIGILGILISTLIGMIVGGIAGYFGGVADFLLMRGVEALLAVPSLYFILILRQMFGSGLSSMQLYLIIVIILAFIGWATEARVIRGMVLSLKEQEYVLAARALGFSNARIIVRHILPNTLSFVIVTATLSVPFYILGEVALSFLGVGIQEPEASWGNMLTAAQNPRYLSDFPWMLAPGFFIFVAVMAWNFLGDGLRDATDPRTLS